MLARPAKAGVLTLLLAVASLALGGCSITADERLAAELSKINYPRSAPLGDDLDIVVERFGTEVTFTNRTARSFRNVQVWLNQQYVNTPATVLAGSDNSNGISVGDFVDWHGRSYPYGGFLRPDWNYPIVLAEIFDPATGTRHRLLARP